MMSNNVLTPETIVSVTNRSNGTVVYRIPERHIRREFNRKETKRVPYQEILEVVAQPGGRELIYNFLLVNNAEALREALNVKEEPEYWLTEDKIAGDWMEKSTLDEFKDALDFAPEGVKALIKRYAVSKPLNDVAKRQALLEQLNFDVTKAIANDMIDKEPSNNNNNNKLASADIAQNNSSGRRTNSAATNYKIIMPKTE